MCGLLSSDGSGNGGSKSGVVEYPRCVLMYAQREGVSAGGAMRSAGEAFTGRQPDRERKLMVKEILDNILYSGYTVLS